MKAGITVKKVLTPLERDGLANTTFNPYALKIGDKIKVTLQIGATKSDTYSLTDEFLTVPSVVNRYVCGTPKNISQGGADGGDKVVWNGVNSAIKELSYECTVGK